MRKGLFALLLVLASFAGGAAVNGPGLQWAKDQLISPVLGNPTIDEADTEADRLELPAAPPPPLEFPSITQSPKAEPAEPEPIASESARPGGLTPEAEPAQTDPALENPEPEGQAPPAVAAPRAPSIANSRDPESARDPSSDSNSKTEPEPDAPDAPPRLFQPLDIPKPSPVPGSNDHDQDDFPDAPDSAPAEAILPGAADLQPPKRDSNLLLANGFESEMADSTAQNHAESTVESDWDRIQRRLKELGVSRYWIEGQTEGPVVFRCLVPTIGGRVVSQHFEAEGDDAIQAAEVALGRVALWRTTTGETQD